MTRLSTVLDPAILADVDLPAFSKASGISLTRLEEISAGADPSIYELGEIADLVGERPAYLIRPRPAVVARRDSGVANAAMDRMLEVFDRHVSAYRYELEQPALEGFPVTTGRKARIAGEKWAALHAMVWAGGDTDPLVDSIEQDLRIPVLFYPVSDAPFGATLLLHDTVAIWVNSHDTPGSQQRFTLAHELGHILLRHLDKTRIEETGSPEDAPQAANPAQQQLEVQANAYAAGVLYDRERVHALWDGEHTSSSVARIAAGLGISYEAACVAVDVHLKDRAPNLKGIAQASAASQAFIEAGCGDYVDWYESRRGFERLPQNLNRLDLLEQAFASLDD